MVLTDSVSFCGDICLSKASKFYFARSKNVVTSQLGKLK